MRELLAAAWRRPAALAAGLMAVYVVGVAPSLGQSLLESHAFRQTQTAYTAVLYADRGIDLLRPPLPILGPSGVVPLEFPLFQAAGAIVMNAGVSADMAMRLTGLACFIGAGVLLYLLAQRLVGPMGALIALPAYLFNAHAWLYGRTSLIEYLAAGGGLAFLYFALRWSEGAGRAHWALALVGGAVAVLVKITTGVFYLVPALFTRSPTGRWGFQQPGTWALLAAVSVIGLGWSSYAQGVRAETPASDFLALQSQVGWLFGTIGQRLDPGEWRVPLVAVLMLTGFGFLVWAPAAYVGARRVGQPTFLRATLLMAVAPPLILFNLYAVHDYYFSAVAPLVALAIGTGASWLWSIRRRRWSRRAMVSLTGAWLATIIGVSGTWSLIYGTPPEEERALHIAAYIREHSDPGDWVVLRGLGWNPTFLYYARRQGISVPDHDGLQDTSQLDLEAVLSDPRLGPEITCDGLGACSVTDDRQ